MLKKRYVLLIILLIILIISPVVANMNNYHFNDFIDEKISEVKTGIGLEKEENYEPEDMYETVIIEVYGYDQLKDEIKKASTWDNKSYIFNLNDGDYNITQPIDCGSSHSNSQYTINGNDHIIDGQNKYQFMKLYANLKLKNLTIQNTYFNYNTSSVISMESVSNLYIENCLFINNHGKSKGSVVTNRGTCIIINSIFKNNSVEDTGGAIWSTGQYGGNITVKDCIFDHNYANLNKNNDRTALIYMVSYGNNTLENNQFINNEGRCIHAFNLTNTSIINNKFINNTMNENDVIRGGIIDNYEADMIVDHNEFTDDITTGELRGGIIYHEIGNLEFINNKIDISNINQDPTSLAQCNKGGVIFNRNASIIIANNEFNNIMKGNYSRGGVIYNNIGEITLKDNKFTNTLEGNNIRGLTIFNDVNSILNIYENTFESKLIGSLDNSEDKYIYNSNVKNDEGNSRIGKINYIN